MSAPDPMWHGGLSGEESFYLHEGRPLATPDQTSPPLHELFHVLAPFRPTAADGNWIGEGLAEYYSLELQHRIGLVDQRRFHQGLELFSRHGKWNVDLTAERDNAATNNSAPLVFFALDRRIARRTAGTARLDDVVVELSRDGGRVSTARLLRALRAVSGEDFGPFFERHVYSGQPVNLDEAAAVTTSP